MISMTTVTAALFHRGSSQKLYSLALKNPHQHLNLAKNVIRVKNSNALSQYAKAASISPDKARLAQKIERYDKFISELHDIEKNHIKLARLMEKSTYHLLISNSRIPISANSTDHQPDRHIEILPPQSTLDNRLDNRTASTSGQSVHPREVPTGPQASIKSPQRNMKGPAPKPPQPQLVAQQQRIPWARHEAVRPQLTPAPLNPD